MLLSYNIDFWGAIILFVAAAILYDFFFCRLTDAIRNPRISELSIDLFFFCLLFGFVSVCESCTESHQAFNERKN